MSLAASPKFFSSKCKKLYKSKPEVEKLSLLCRPPGIHLLPPTLLFLLCLLPFLYNINTLLYHLPSSRIVLTVGTYRKNGRKEGRKKGRKEGREGGREGKVSSH